MSDQRLATPARILIIEDDRPIRRFLEAASPTPATRWLKPRRGGWD